MKVKNYITLGGTIRGFQYVINSVVKRFRFNRRMAGSAHLETAVTIVFFLSGVVFPFGSTCTGEYNATVISIGGR